MTMLRVRTLREINVLVFVLFYYIQKKYIHYYYSSVEYREFFIKLISCNYKMKYQPYTGHYNNTVVVKNK